MAKNASSSPCRIVPAGTKVLVKLEKYEPKTKSGLYLAPKEDVEAPPIGEVVAISKEITVKLDFKVGDRVLFEKGLNYDVHTSVDEDVQYTLVSYYDVIAVLDKETVIEMNKK